MIISPTILIVTNLRIFFDPWNFPPTIIIIIIITSWILESKERSSTRTTVENNGNDDCGWFSQRQLSPFLSFDLRFLVFSSTLLLMHTCQYRRIYIYIYIVSKHVFFATIDRSIDQSRIFTRISRLTLPLILSSDEYQQPRLGSSNDNIYLPINDTSTHNTVLRKRVKRKRIRICSSIRGTMTRRFLPTFKIWKYFKVFRS